MTDAFRHNPRLQTQGFLGQDTPEVYEVSGPHKHDKTECYICIDCGAVYEDSPSNVCAAKLLKDKPS